MANVPTIPVTGAETTDALPTPFDTRANSPEAFGAAIGEGLGHLSKGIEKAQQEADLVAVQEAETEYAKGVLEKIHTGRVDPDTGEQQPGFRQLQGHDALARSADFTDDLERSRNEIAQGLTNDRQRRLFLQRSQGEYLSGYRAIELHTGEQTQKIAQDAFRARVSVAGQTALAAYTDPAEVDRQILGMSPWLAQEAQRLGLKGDAAIQFTEKWQGAVAEDVLTRMMADEGRSQQARRFFEDYQGLLGDKAAKFAHALQAANVRDQAAGEEARIWQDSGQDGQKALEMVRAIPDVAVRDETGKRLAQRVSQDHAMRVAADAPRLGRLDQAIYQGRGLDRRDPDYQALSDEGKAVADAHARASERGDNSEQRLIDAELRAFYSSLPLKGETGQDQVSIDILSDPRFASGSQTLRYTLQGAQKKAVGEWNKDSGASEANFKAQARKVADELGYSGKEGTATTPRGRFMDDILARRSAWLEQHPEAKGVLTQDAQTKIFEDALRYVDPGFLKSNVPAWRVRGEGEFPQAKEQPGLEALKRVITRTQPAGQTIPVVQPPRGKVRLIGPPGSKSWQVDDGPQVDDWLKANPGWRRG